MPRYTMLISTSPVDGREGDYNDWYDGRHLGDVLSLEGFVSAQRFRLAEVEPAQKAPHRYLAIYEVEAPSVEAAGKLLADGFASGRIPVSDALDVSSVQMLYFEALTDRRVP